MTICHKNEGNGWSKITVDWDAVNGIGGGDHNSSKHHNGQDIIPAGFWYNNGRNWDAAGQAIWNNDCNVPQPTPTPTQEITPTPTVEVTPTPTEEVTPTPTVEVTPEVTQEVTPTIEPTVEPTPTLIVERVTPTDVLGFGSASPEVLPETGTGLGTILLAGFAVLSGLLGRVILRD